jgi:hypothetical protein
VARAKPAEVPAEFGIRSTFPNPFNSRMEVRFGMDRADRVTVEVLDLLGRQCNILFSGPVGPGVHRVTWSADGMASGVYLIRLVAGDRERTAKVLLIR